MFKFHSNVFFFEIRSGVTQILSGLPMLYQVILIGMLYQFILNGRIHNMLKPQ